MKRLPATNYENPVIHRISDTSFSVKFEKQSHTVSIAVPTCDCVDWFRYGMPCKHLLAVVTCVDGLSWASLPDSYRNFPLFILDNSVCFANDDSNNRQQSLNDTTVRETDTVGDDCLGANSEISAVETDELASVQEVNVNASSPESCDVSNRLLKQQSRLRQKLTSLSAYTYIITDEAFLQAVTVDIERVFVV